MSIQTSTLPVSAEDQVRAIGAGDGVPDPIYDLTEQPIFNKSTIATEEYEITPSSGASDLTNVFNKENDIIEFKYPGLDPHYPAGIHWKMQTKQSYASALGPPVVAHVAHADDTAGIVATDNILKVFNRAEIAYASSQFETIDFIGIADSILKALMVSQEFVNTAGSVGGYTQAIESDSLGVVTATDYNSVKRKARMMPATGANNKVCFWDIRLPIPILTETCKVVKGLPFTIRLFRAKNDSLFGKAGTGDTNIPILTVEKLSMFVPVLRPDLAISNQIDQLVSMPYSLQYTGYKVTRTQKNADASATPEFNEQISSMFSRPSKAYVCLQDKRRVDGALTAAGAHMDPNLFDNAGIKSMQLTIDKQRKVPYLLPESDFSTGDVCQVFRETLRCAGTFTDYDSGCLLNVDSFTNLFPIFGFDLKGSAYSNIPEINKGQNHTIDLSIKFRSALTQSYYIYIVYLFDNVAAVIGKSGVVSKVYGE